MMRKEAFAVRKEGPYIPKSQNYHLALAEYLYNELRRSGVQAYKENEVCIRIVKKNDPHNLIVDCLDGYIYLRANKNEKRIGKLSGFASGYHWSDAYACMRASIRPILKKLESYASFDVDNNEEDVDKLPNDDVVKVRDLRDSDISPTDFVLDLRNGDNNVEVIPLRDFRASVNQVQIITKDLRVPKRNFVSIVKKLLKGLISKVF